MPQTGSSPARVLRNAAPPGAAFFFFFGWLLMHALPAAGSDVPGNSTLLSGSNAFQGSVAFASEPPVEGTLHIVAVMAEFQPDDNPFTSGNGTFGPGAIPYLENPGTSIDPLPHDRGHFEAHLEFAKRYFEYHSKDRLTITYQVLDSVIRLPHPMEAYSPIGQDPDPAPLANLARDTWETLQLQSESIEAQPQDDLLFVIFHAGIGRDIQLSGTTLDKTPQDIPSVYLSRDAFRELFNDPAFTGFPIQNSSRLISNSIILPRTNTRAGESITGETFLLPLSINGLLTAQIGSHLGLPDLFNTQTGESGIGRFGLMDGAGIFSYNGLFPPELSAWEKIHLGWETPKVLSPATLQPNEAITVDLPAASLRQPDSIVKIPLSTDEYYLIENRHRDPLDTGVTLTIRTPEGTLVEQTFTNQDSVFVFQNSGFDEELTPGVVIDAQPYDFSLPGGEVRDENTRRVLNGGILIWRVDESIIRARTEQSQGINDLPERRGIEVMEADGAQDIGRPVQLGFSQNEVNGSAFDFWFEGNNARVITQTGSEIILYQNRFADDTTPSSRSHSGAPSFLEWFDFSENLPVANFSLRPTSPYPGWIEKTFQAELPGGRFINPFSTISTENEATGLSSEVPARYPLSMVSYNAGDDAEDDAAVLIPGQEGLFAYGGSTEEIVAMDSRLQPLQRQPLLLESLGQVLVLDVGGEPFAKVENSAGGNVFTGGAASARGAPSAGEATTMTLNSYALSDLSGEALWGVEVEAGSETGLLSSDRPGRVLLDGTSISINPITQTIEPNGLGESLTLSELEEQNQIRITPTGLLQWTSAGETLQTSVPVSAGERLHVGWIQFPQAFLVTDRVLYRVEKRGDELEVEALYESEQLLGWPAVADISGDGDPDFMFIDPARNELIAVHASGALLDRFPYHIPDVTLTGTPLIADLNGDQQMEMVVAGYTESSVNLYLLDSERQPMEGSPLLVGGAPEAGEGSPLSPALFGSSLFAVSPSGDLTVWNFPAMGDRLWGNVYGGQNNKVRGALSEPTREMPAFGVLLHEETYNWPNPARDHTFVRFQLSGAGSVDVLVTTSSGVPVFETSVTAAGGVPEEIEIDTSEWASGGYLARVSATVQGSTERKLIKIAVVK